MLWLGDHQKLVWDCYMLDQICQQAAKHGRFDFIKYLMQSSPTNSYPISMSACGLAAENGHLQLLSYLLPKYIDMGIPSYTRDCLSKATCFHAGRMAIRGGQTIVLEWILQINSTLGPCFCAEAADNNDFPLLIWLHRQGCAWDYRCTASAARVGNLQMLKYLSFHGCEMTYMICSEAAGNGRLDILLWARHQTCEWRSDVFENAAKQGHIKILEYALEYECPGLDPSLLTQTAANYGRIEVLIWAKVHGIHLGEELLIYAASRGQSKVVRWLHETGVRADTFEMFYAATGAGDYGLMCWLKEHDYPCDLVGLAPHDFLWERSAIYKWCSNNNVGIDLDHKKAKVLVSVRNHMSTEFVGTETWFTAKRRQLQKTLFHIEVMRLKRINNLAQTVAFLLSAELPSF